MNDSSTFRLEGLEPDNLLAFLALLGVLRSLEAHDGVEGAGGKLNARVRWELDENPVRPILAITRPLSQRELLERIDGGLMLLAAEHDFGGRKDLNYPVNECRKLLLDAAGAASISARRRIDLLAALMTDGAVKDPKSGIVRPTPLCLMFGQGHQHFLERLAQVPAQPSPPPRGRGKQRHEIDAAECLAEALFAPWNRADPTSSFRWDPEEDVRYALMAGDPTDPAYKRGTQHGANRLAAVGIQVFAVSPGASAQTPVTIPGGRSQRGFTLAWPIWRTKASLEAIRAMLAHPDLRTPARLRHLDVVYVYETQRHSVGKFMNMTRAAPLME